MWKTGEVIHVDRLSGNERFPLELLVLRWLLDIFGETLSVQLERDEGEGFRLKSFPYVQKAETCHETGSAQPGLPINKRGHLSMRPESLHV